MLSIRITITAVLMAAQLAAAGSARAADGFTPDQALVERGRYVARIAGCNDCHTDGYANSNGEVPESQWLTGDSFGWRGPWGTTYGSNVRLFAAALTEEQWVQAARTLRRRPPMPWFNLNTMEEDDLKALYHFMRSLGDPGPAAPMPLAPDVEPAAPYAVWVLQNQPVVAGK